MINIDTRERTKIQEISEGWHPDSTTIIEGCTGTAAITDDCEITLLNLATSHMSHLHCMNQVTAVAVSANFKRACVATIRNLLLWDVVTNGVVELSNYNEDVKEIVVTSDGGLAATISKFRPHICIWDLNRCSELHMLNVSEYTGHGRSGSTDRGDPLVALSQDGTRLLTANLEDKEIVVVDMATGNFLQNLTGHIHPVTDIVISGDGRYAMACTWPERKLYAWELDTGKNIACVITHSPPSRLAFSPGDSSIAFIGHLDGAVTSVKFFAPG